MQVYLPDELWDVVKTRRGSHMEHLDAGKAASKCDHGSMRTTIILERDVVQAVRQLRRRRGVGLSEAVNALIRQGLRPQNTA